MFNIILLSTVVTQSIQMFPRIIWCVIYELHLAPLSSNLIYVQQQLSQWDQYSG